MSRLLAILLLSVALAACAGAQPSVAPSTSAPAAPPITATPPAPAPTAIPSVPSPQPTSIGTPAAVAEEAISIVMTDAMRFEPGDVAVRVGRPITFRVENAGVAVHELFIGTADQQAEHAVEMAAGAAAHSHGNALTLEGGRSGELTITFDRTGQLLMGCHEPGHYAAGMVGLLTVVD